MAQNEKTLVGSDVGKSSNGTLAHYGVKGMRWGIRRSRDSSSGGSMGPREVQVFTKGNGQVNPRKVKGGQDHPASEDARQAIRTGQIARKSGTQALSNKELQALINRLNLEASYAKTMASSGSQKSAGRKFLEDLIKSETTDAWSKGKTGGPVTAAVSVAMKKRRGKAAAAATAAAAAKATGRVVAGVVVNR